MKTAAAVLGASLLFFLGVLTGVGRREAVPPPVAIPLGVSNTPASGSSPSTDDAPADGAKRTTTTTAAGAPSPTNPSATPGPTGTPGATATTKPSGTTAPTASSTTATTARSGVEQVDGQVECRGRGQGNGKRETCPSTTTATGEAPGGRGAR